MENVTKALLIAAGVFLAVLLLSALLVAYNDVSTYYAQQHELTVIEQTQEFNAKFENYHREDIRGTDLLSLMNRVIDYNASQSYQDGTNYERIRVTITLGNGDILKQFKYETNDTTSRNQYLLEEISNTTGSGANWQNDKDLIKITNTSSYLCEDYSELNLTDTKLQQLSSEIANIIVDEDDDQSSMVAYSRFKRAQLLENLLGITVRTSGVCNIKIDAVTGITKSDPNNIIGKVKEIASQYYQYTQFKRAYFDCTEVQYDTETNRVEKMNFKLQTKTVNGVETVVFD